VSKILRRKCLLIRLRIPPTAICGKERSIWIRVVIALDMILNTSHQYQVTGEILTLVLIANEMSLEPNYKETL